MFRHALGIFLLLAALLFLTSLTHAAQIEAIVKQIKADLGKKSLLDKVESNLGAGENMNDVLAFAYDFARKTRSKAISVQAHATLSGKKLSVNFPDVVKALNFWCWLPYPIFRKAPEVTGIIEKNRGFLVRGAYQRAMVQEVENKVLATIRLKDYEKLKYTDPTAKPVASLSNVVDIGAFQAAFQK